MAEPALIFAIPGSLDTPTGGYVYDAKVIDGLRQRGHEIEILALGDDFPMPDETTRGAASEKLIAAACRRIPLLVDGLALGVLPEAARQVASRTPLVALVHHPLAEEHGLPPEMAAAFRASETSALSEAIWVVATSATTARLLQTGYGVDPARLRVARPGTDPVEMHDPQRPQRPVRLLSVGAISPRKGFDLLVGALADLRHLDWRLTIVGDTTRSPLTSAALREQIASEGLDHRIDLTGAASRSDLDRLHRGADIFVLASHYEGYGMAYAEALAHGLPVIGTTGGAIPEVVPALAGILVPPGDMEALRSALLCMIDDAELRGEKAVGARRAALALPRWQETVDVIECVTMGLRSRR